jgi:uncharacterized membrane protein
MDYILRLLIVIVILAFLSYILAEQHPHYEIYYFITVGFLAASFSLAFSSAYYRILK